MDENREKIIIEVDENGKDIHEGDEHISTRRLLSFTLGNDKYCVDINEVREVILIEKITRVPSTPDFVVGVINLRGDIVPVLDICNFLYATGGESKDEQKALIVEIEGGVVGLLVSDVNKTIDVSEQDIQPTLLTIEGKIAKHIKGQVQLESGIQVLLSLPKLFESDEIKALNTV